MIKGPILFKRKEKDGQATQIKSQIDRLFVSESQFFPRHFLESDIDIDVDVSSAIKFVFIK